MEISATGLSLIRAHEGFGARPYTNPLGATAIGYGHTYAVTSATPEISRPDAARLLERDIAGSFGPAIDALGLPLTQSQFDATCSFIYQVGADALGATSHFGAQLRAGDWRGAADAMLDYIRYDGAPVAELLSRRTIERALFLAPEPTGRAPEPTGTALEAVPATAPAAMSAAAGHGAEVSANGNPLALEKKILTTLRQHVWLAAVRGRQPDGTATQPGWDREGRAERYKLLGRLTGRNPAPK